MSKDPPRIVVRNTQPSDFEGIVELTRAVYKDAQPWTHEQLDSHLSVFPKGQFVAIEPEGRLVGMAASLVMLWDDYAISASWRDFTASGHFTNHDPQYGRTLYGAEVMVHPDSQGLGIGKQLYKARFELTERLGLLRIRAGARLRGYHQHAGNMSAEEYVSRISRRELRDPTLSFQLNQGFEVIAVVSNYLRHDPESLGYAAVIEWLNPAVAKPEDYAARRLLQT
ncbi:MAG: GNAT family N-acetyltransferase [Acidobacteriota bacterium]